MECSSTAFWLFSSLFVCGYAAIALEQSIRIDKGAIALLMATVMWGFLINDGCRAEEVSLDMLQDHFGAIAQVVFFLMGALAIVEVLNSHRSFNLIEKLFKVGSKKSLLWALSLITFFLSSILDNMTSTVVMISLLRHFLPEGEDRKIIGGCMVIAANAGGAWTPIGDVTTTMLWIGGQISTGSIIYSLLLPSLTCLIVAVMTLGRHLHGELEVIPAAGKVNDMLRRELILVVGLLALVGVPLLKVFFGLPPFMGVFFGFSILWALVDRLYDLDERQSHLKMLRVLQRIDYSALFFFCGILLAVDALESAGILRSFSLWLDTHVTHMGLIAVVMGLASAVIDNVPLVAAMMGMYPLQGYPSDTSFWHLVAYCAGTGGSILLIGSAAGVVYMGLEKVSFGWYTRRISWAAFLGYFSGIAVYWMIGSP